MAVDDSKKTEETEGVPSEAGSDASLLKTRSANFVLLVAYLRKQSIDPAAFLHVSSSTLKRIEEGKQNASFFAIWRLEKAFSKISYRLVRNGQQALPANEDYGFEQRTSKLRYLDQYLQEKEEGLTLARALSLSDAAWSNLQSGYTLPSNHLMKKAAVYFSLPPKLLLNDQEQLPPFEDLRVDSDLAAVQRNDLSEQINKERNKHYIARNFRVLSHRMRVKLYGSLLVMLLPLAAFTGFCTYDILQSRQSSLASAQQSDITDATSKTFQKDYIDTHSQGYSDSTGKFHYYPLSVKMGVQVSKIFDIQPANEYYSVFMTV